MSAADFRSPGLAPDAVLAAAEYPVPGFFSAKLAHVDPELAAAISGELVRQQDQLEMIASENIVSRAVRARALRVGSGGTARCRSLRSLLRPRRALPASVPLRQDARAGACACPRAGKTCRTLNAKAFTLGRKSLNAKVQTMHICGTRSADTVHR